MRITIPIILVIAKGELGSDREALEILNYLTATSQSYIPLAGKKAPCHFMDMKKASKGYFPDAFFVLPKK